MVKYFKIVFNALMIIMMAVFLFTGCASKQAKPEMKSGNNMFTDEERELILSGNVTNPFKVVQNDNKEGDEFLRDKAKEINIKDNKLELLIARMMITAEVEEGVGIAAPQIGVHRRVILVRRLDKKPDMPMEVYINPYISSYSDEKIEEWEGCLSVPAGFAPVIRPESIELVHMSIDGQKIEETITGFTARIFQHEIDHLDGVLFIDRLAKDTAITPKEEYKEMREAEQAEAEQAEAEQAEAEQAAAEPSESDNMETDQ